MWLKFSHFSLGGGIQTGPKEQYFCRRWIRHGKFVSCMEQCDKNIWGRVLLRFLISSSGLYIGYAYKVIPVDKSRYVKLKNPTNLGSPKQNFEIHAVLDYQTMTDIPILLLIITKCSNKKHLGLS